MLRKFSFLSSSSPSRACAPLNVHVRIHCIAPDGRVAKDRDRKERRTMKEKRRRQGRTYVKQKRRLCARERQWEWCVVDIRTYVCITKKEAFTSLFNSLRFSLSRSLSFSFSLFFSLPLSLSLSFSLVCFFFLALASRSFSFPSHRRSYRRTTILEPQCFLSIPWLLSPSQCVWGGQRGEGTREWGEMLLSMCALIDSLLYLSRSPMTRRMWMKRTTQKTATRARPRPLLLPVDLKNRPVVSSSLSLPSTMLAIFLRSTPREQSIKDEVSTMIDEYNCK